MIFLGFLAREMMRSRAHRNRGRYRRSTWGVGPRRPRSRAYYGWGHQPRGYPARHRRGGNVRVVGCCLPIPIGAMALLMMLRTGLTRGGR